MNLRSSIRSSGPWVARCAVLAVLAGAAHADTVKLRNGTVLVGKVLDATSQGLTFKRADNGGTLDLTWEHLAPEAVEEVKREKGLIVRNEEEVLVPAVALKVMTPSGKIEPYLGEIVGRDGDNVLIKSKGRVVPIQATAIRATEYPRVPVREIYTLDEFYNLKLGEMQPGEDAKKHVQLGELLSRVRDYDHALLHLNKALTLGGGDQADTVKGLIKEVEIRRDNREQADLLAEIVTLSNRNDFKKARELADKFAKQYPDSKLKGDLEGAKQRLERERETFMIRRVTALWMDYLRDISGDKSRDRAAKVEEIRKYCQEELGRQIRERIVKSLGITVEEVNTFFRKRLDKGRPSPNTDLATYGAGTWLLGEAEIQAHTELGKKADEAAKQKDPTGAGKENEALRKRIQEFMKRAKQAQQGMKGSGGSADGLMDEDTYWKEAEMDERRQWIMACYAEKGGDMQIVPPAYLKPCPSCSARGKIEDQDPMSGQIVQHPCPLCHGKKWFRTVRFH